MQKCKLHMEIWALSNPLDVQNIFTGLYKGMHCHHFFLHCWVPDVWTDFILICLKWRRAGEALIQNKSCFLQNFLSPEQNKCTDTYFRRFWQGSHWWNLLNSFAGWSLLFSTKRILESSATEMFYNMLETGRIKFMSPNCKWPYYQLPD